MSVLVQAVSEKVYGFKACRDCGHVKHCTDFYLQSGGNSLASYCKPCLKARSHKSDLRLKKENPERHREKKTARNLRWMKNRPEIWTPQNRKNGLKFKYGMTPADYDRMVLEQEGKCALCGTTEVGSGKNRSGKAHERWMIDHCHVTNKVRGLLCLKCNTRLGAYEILRDSIGLEKVTKYLARSRS